VVRPKFLNAHMSGDLKNIGEVKRQQSSRPARS